MNREQHLAVLREYAENFSKWEGEAVPREHYGPIGMGRAIKHAKWMVDEMIRRLESGEEASAGQADRWIGFIQGVFWMHGFYNIDEMAKANLRPVSE